MVDRHVAARGVKDPRVLDAMREVPRHLFVPSVIAAKAYGPGALPIGSKQTISQPYIVAVMVEAAAVGRNDRVLEVGTGSGYAAAVLGELADHVYTLARGQIGFAGEPAELAGADVFASYLGAELGAGP